MSRTPVFVTLVVMIAAMCLATAYAVLSIAGRVPISVPILFGWFGLLNLFTLLLTAFFWRRRALFGIGAKVLVMLWGALALWYWLPAPTYYFINMNYDLLQLRWMAFAWLWEVPLVGGLHVLVCSRLFRPIQAYMAGRARVADPGRLYGAVLRYPVVVGLSMFIVSVLGYGIGALQFRVFAAMPLIEQGKNLFNGAVIALFLSVLYYLMFENFLGPVRERIERDHALKDTVKTTITWKIFGVTLLITLGSLALVSLVVLQSFQLMVKEQLVAHTRRAMTQLEPQLQRAQTVGELESLVARLRYGARGRVFVLSAGIGVPADLVSHQTWQTSRLGISGVIQDLQHDLKIVGTLHVPTLEQNVVVITYLTDFYQPLGTLARFFAWSGLFVVILTVGIITMMSLVFTKAVRWLSSAVKRATPTTSPAAVHVNTADEIEDLSHTFAYFIGQSQELRLRLEGKVRELARSNAELEQFAYVASHDLQEPLRMVASYVQLLKRRYQGALDRDADEFIGFAVDGVTRMQRLITELLTYSRLGTHGQPFTPTNCARVLEQVLSQLQVTIREHQAVVTREALPTVSADASQIGQVFQNLLSNALKFHGDAIPHIHVGASAQDHSWVFSVRDNGIGLDPQYAERIFVIFQRLHTRATYPGTGMGLAICKKVVERHGGRIWVESQPGKGTTVSFTLPRNTGMVRDDAAH